MSENEGNSGFRRIVMTVAALLAAVVIAVGWWATDGFGLKSGESQQSSQQDDGTVGSSSDTGYGVPDVDDDRVADIPQRKRKDIKLPTFEGLDRKDVNAVILNFLNVIYNTDVERTDSPQANALRAKGLMTETFADQMEKSDEAAGPSNRWILWGDRGVVLRSSFSLDKNVFNPKKTFCPKPDPNTQGKCSFDAGGEEIGKDGETARRVVIVNQRGVKGSISVPDRKFIVRVVATKGDGSEWSISAMTVETLKGK